MATFPGVRLTEDGAAANPELAGQIGKLEASENGASLVVFGAVATWIRDEWVALSPVPALDPLTAPATEAHS
jgi:hypothetical protein